MTINKKLLIFFVLVPLAAGFFRVEADPAPAALTPDFPEARTIRALLQQPENEIDLATTKIAIDQLVDPTVDIDVTLSLIKGMASDIRGIAGFNASSEVKVDAIRQYLYKSGEWNNKKPFQYDFDDPLGTKIANKLLHNYITERKGNCITMPFLFIILGDRLGVDATAATAPLHVLVKYTNSATGVTQNLEATSGALPMRDSWYRKHLPMTDQAIANGVYLKPLTRRETVAVMATVLAEHYFQEGEYEKAIVISDISLEYYPKYVNAMLRKGSAYYRLLEKHFTRKYPSPRLIPAEQRDYFHYLSRNNQLWFARAEALGWREPGKSVEDNYLRNVERDARSAR